MAMRDLFGRPRGALLAAMVSTTLGVWLTVTVQGAQASSTGTPPIPPKITAHQGSTMHAMTANAQVTPAATATNVHCGQLITASVTLNGNLYCSGDGLTVGGSSVVLNLNGFGISGPGSASGTGVAVTGKSATVENGWVDGFQYGVTDSGTTDTLTKLRLTYDLYGITEYGTGNKITANEAYGNDAAGIAAFGNATVVTGNRAATNDVSGNGDPGIYIGGVKDTVTGNYATDTVAGDGIQDIGSTNTFTSNVADFNQKDGIFIFDSNVIDGGGNLAKGNDTVPAGSVPEQCSEIVCT